MPGNPTIVGGYEIEIKRKEKVRIKIRPIIAALSKQHRFADAKALCDFAGIELSDFKQEVIQAL